MTDLSRWPEVKQVVQGALNLPPEARAAYLDEACGDDKELRQEVEALLAISSTEADFFDDYTVVPPSMETLTFTEGNELGPYRIIREIGKGGMGAVYLAEDREHGRNVALKTVPRHSQRALLHEKRLLASLRHANIAILFDSGQTEAGLGYFIMEYVEGEPITSYCDRLKLTIRQRLELFLSVCDAVAYAHRNLVVHRDLKPKNILVTAEGEVKLLDFGIAKLLPSEPMLVPSEGRSFTMAFASPEQLEGERTTTATDIYSLGVLLCLLLTGRLPYPVKSATDLPWAIRNLAPEKPSVLALKEDGALNADGIPISASNMETRSLARQLRGDLDAIVIKALQKEPGQRYQTVTELSADIQRALDDEPVSARDGNVKYRALKFCKRHTVAVIATAAALLLILGLLVGLFLEQRETARQRDQAQDVARVLNEIFMVDNPWNVSGEQVTAREMLDRAVKYFYTISLEPKRKATALYTLGTLYAQLGIHPRAKTLLSESLNLRTLHLGSVHDDTIATQNALGGTLYYLAEYKEAEHLLKQAEIALRARKDDRQTALVSVLTNLARVYFEQGKPEDAERLERECLQILETTGRGESQEAAEIHSHLGLTLTRLDRLPEAEAHHRRALSIRTRLFGPDHPTTGSAHHNLALNLNSQRKYAEAEKHYYKALRIARRSLPKEHPIIPAILDSLASTYAHQKRFAESEALLREAIAIKRQILPKTHPSIPLSITNLATIITESDPSRLPEAEALYREAIGDFRRLAGSTSRQVGITLYTYGRALFRSGQPFRARPITEEALRILETVNGSQHLETALVKRTHAQVLLELNDPQAAEPFLVDTVRVFREHHPYDPHELASTLTLLGRCRRNLGTLQEAEHSLREAYTLFSDHHDLSSPEGKTLLAELNTLRTIQDRKNQDHRR